MRSEADARAAIVAEALSWRGTRYENHGAVKGCDGGVDCAQLVAQVYMRAGVIEKITVPHYSPQHFLHSDREWYVEVILGFAREITEAESRPGDVVTFKMGRSHGHGAILIPPGWPHLVHAWGPARMVVRGDGTQENLSARRRERRFFSAFPLREEVRPCNLEESDCGSLPNWTLHDERKTGLRSSLVPPSPE